MGFLVLAAPTGGSALLKRGEGPTGKPPQPVSGPPPKPPLDGREKPVNTTAHATQPVGVQFEPNPSVRDRIAALGRHFRSYSSPELALARAIPEFVPLFEAATGRSGGMTYVTKDFRVMVKGNQMTIKSQAPDCSILLARHRDGSLYVEATGKFVNTGTHLAGSWKNGVLSIGQMKAQHHGVGLAYRGSVAGLPPGSIPFTHLAPALQKQYAPMLALMGTKPEQAWVFWNCVADAEGCHVELGILRKNPAGPFHAFALTGDKDWMGMATGACRLMEKQLLPKLVKAAPQLAPKLTRVVPGVSQAVTSFEAGWSLGRAIGKLVVDGRSVDEHVQGFFCQVMGIKE